MSSIFSDGQLATMVQLLDTVVPPDAGIAGAGQAGVARYLEAASSKSPRVARVVLETVRRADSVAGLEHQRSFLRLTPDQRVEALKLVEQQAPDIFHEFLIEVYGGYYTDPDVVGRLGPDAVPPQPRGFPTKPFDPAIVEHVQKLGPSYRAVDTQ